MLRPLTDRDLEDARKVYRAAALESDPEYYDEAQRREWAKTADEDAFSDFLLGDESVGAFDGARMQGFSSYTTEGYIKSLYVAPGDQRSGIGSRLLEAVLANITGAKRKWAVASIFSKPLFEKYGFRLVEVEHVLRGNAEFERYIMELKG